jgi:hypothetical protein
MIFNQFYHLLKPLIPRKIQIELRRVIVRKKRVRYADVWPIDPTAGNPPEEWAGWPDGKKFALVLTHDVETAKGQEKCATLASLEKDLGVRSSFNFPAKAYKVSSQLRDDLLKNGFEVGVHGLYHDGNLFSCRKKFRKQAFQVNRYLKEWGVVGFRTPCMYHNLDWIHDLDIEYDASTFDTDPFEPQPDGMRTIFPFWVHNGSTSRGYLELPYTLPQDFTVFVLMKERKIDIWKKKIDWIAEKGGMALLITHPDYMNCKKSRCKQEEYPMEVYQEFLEYVKTNYEGEFWNRLPKEVARFWKEKIVTPQSSQSMTQAQRAEETE